MEACRFERTTASRSVELPVVRNPALDSTSGLHRSVCWLRTSDIALGINRAAWTLFDELFGVLEFIAHLVVRPCGRTLHCNKVAP